MQVETIGDCYFVAGGLIHEDEDGMAAVGGKTSGMEDPLHADKIFMFAKVGYGHGMVILQCGWNHGDIMQVV